jgi:protein TonB
MKKSVLIALAIITFVACTKKTNNEQLMHTPSAAETICSPDNEEEDIFTVVSQMPEFPGGMGELMKYLGESIKYPSKARDNQWEGRVLCQFIVEKDGSISNAEIVQSSGYQLLDVEAMRVVLNMPNWSSGKQDGDSVRVKFTLPISFKLQ